MKLRGSSMKKNLISVIILALVAADFVLTALLVFTVLPETQKANALIEDVCSAIDLELSSGGVSDLSNIPIEQIEGYVLNGGETINTNLKDDGTGTHYAVLGVSLSLNTKSENYKKYSPEVLATKEDIILNDINKIVGSYTKAEFDAGTEEVQAEILKDMQNMFGADYIVGVNFSQKQSQ